MISIIVILNNAKSYIHDQMESLKNINFRPLQIIFVDDASTDDTWKLLEKEKIDFQKLGINVCLKRNSVSLGPSGSFNVGFNLVEGEYLVQTDGDDFLKENSIMKMLSVLEETNRSVAQGAINLWDEVTGQYSGTESMDSHYANSVYNWLTGNNTAIYQPGSRMIKTAYLKSVYPDGIYESSQGQNWQILLPAAFENEIVVFEDVVIDVTVRLKSHSRRSRSYEKDIARLNEFKSVWERSLCVVGGLDVHNNLLDEVYNLKKFELDYKHLKYWNMFKSYRAINNKRLNDLIKFPMALGRTAKHLLN